MPACAGTTNLRRVGRKVEGVPSQTCRERKNERAELEELYVGYGKIIQNQETQCHFEGYHETSLRQALSLNTRALR